MRLFFAIDVPEVLKAQLAGLFPLGQATTTLRWVLPQHLHITLQFVAHFRPEDLTILVQSVQKILYDIAPFTLQPTTLALFPQAKRPEFIYLNLLPAPPLHEIAERVKGVIAHHGYPVEKRTYRPHITLARVRHRDESILLTESLADIPALQGFTVRDILLMHSEPTTQGSRYTTLERLSLNHQKP